MSCIYTYKGYKLDEQQLRDMLLKEILSNKNLPILRGYLLSVQSDLNDQLEALKDVSAPLMRGGKTWVSVSRLLELKLRIGPIDSIGMPSEVILSPIYNKDTRITNSIAQLTEKGYSTEDARNLILTQIAEEQAVAEFGSIFHDLASKALKAHGKNSLGLHVWGYTQADFESTLNDQVDKIMASEDYTAEDGSLVRSTYFFLTHSVTGTPDRDQIKQKLKEKIKSLEEKIFLNPEYEGAIIKSELEISTGNKNIDKFDYIHPDGTIEKDIPCDGVKGIADIIVIKDEAHGGGIDIIDIKVATREYDDWYAAKQLHTDYQLGMYRAILGANGFDVSKMHLKVLPVSIEKGNYLTLSFRDEIPGKTALVERTISMRRNHPSHLDPYLGKFTKTIEKIINVSMPEIGENDDIRENNIDHSVNSLIDMFEDEQTEKEYTKEEIASHIHSVTTTNGRTQYKLMDINTHQWIYRSRKEDFTRNGGIIDEMISNRKNKLSRSIESIIETIGQYQQSDNPGTKFEFLADQTTIDEGHQILYNILNSTFGLYASSPLYKIITIPELLDRGIILVQQKVTKTIDVVMLTTDNLRQLRQTEMGDKLLSKFYSEDEINRMNLYTTSAEGILKQKEAMLATKANMKLMEIMCALNECEDKLRNFKIGNIKVVNIESGQLEVGEIDELKANFKALCSATKDSENPIIDNFDSQKIKTQSVAENVVSELEAIMIRTEFSKDIKLLVLKLETDQYEIDQIIEKLTKLKKALLKAYHFQTDKLDFSSPEQIAYFLVSEAISYYHNIHVHGNGKVSKHGLLGGDLKSLFGAGFKGITPSKISQNGYAITGVLQGSYESSPGLSPDGAMFLLQKWIDSGMLKLRDRFFNEVYKINALCKEYEQRNKNLLSGSLLNERTSFFDRLLVKEGVMEDGRMVQGKVSSEMKLQNPYSDECDLELKDKEFLEELLWFFNKWKLFKNDPNKLTWDYKEHRDEIINNELVQKAILSEQYFELPLRRASHFTRLKSIGENGLIQYFLDQWNHLDDNINPFKEHSILTVDLDEKVHDGTTEMWNRYDVSPETRAWILENADSPFETDMNLLAIDIAYQYIRKQCYDEVLDIADAVLTTLLFYNINSDLDLENTIKTIKDQVDVSIKSKSLLEDEWKDGMKAIAAVKKLNSIIILGARPLQLVKESAFGWFTNVSRAIALKGTSNEVSFGSILKSRMLVYGLLLGKYGKSMTSGSEISDFTMIQLINQMYGIANQDSNQLVDKAARSRVGLIPGLSRWLFIFSTAQDFVNRMNLFTAKMMDDGCFEAHELDDRGILHYNFKLDKRFSKLNEIGFFDESGHEIKSNDEEYLKQKALYRAMFEQFQNEGIRFKFGEDLPKAYTQKEKASMKEISDLAYGFYDHETKSLEDFKLFGVIFKQFMTFWTAKTTLWLRAPGSNTSTGKWVNLTDENGNILYRRITETPAGPKLDLITYDEMTDEEKGYLEPQQVWQGDYVEGLLYSCLYTIHDILTLNWKQAFSNPYRVANLKLALHDLLIGLLLYKLILWIFGGDKQKLSELNPVVRSIARAALDIGPQGMWSLNWEPSFWSTLVNIKTDFTKLLAGKKDISDLLVNRIGFLRDFDVDDI